MITTDEFKQLGIEIKKDKYGNSIIGVSSQKISNEQLQLLTKASEDFLLAFYGCDFSECDLKILGNSKFKKVAIIYSNICDRQLPHICAIKSLSWLKIFDTKITPDGIKKHLINNSKIEILFN